MVRTPSGFIYAGRAAWRTFIGVFTSIGGEITLHSIEVGNKIKLYCLRLSDKILVFGNGGVKDASTWEESETLAPYVRLLKDTSRFISSRIKDGTVVLVDKDIIGNFNFSRNEKE